MKKWNRFCRLFASGVLAGVMIGLGGLAFAACSAYETTGIGRIIGSFLFATGLLGVACLGLFLYTGKIGYAFQHGKSYWLDLLIGYFGNLCGALGLGALLAIIPSVSSGAMGMVLKNIATSRDILSMADPWYQALLLSFLCGILVFVAVEIFRRKGGVLGALGLILAVAAFVVTGMEHTIANMFYFAGAGLYTGGLVLNILITTLGNSLGALFFERLLYAGTRPDGAISA